MIRFLLKGLLRDRQRSLLPAIVVALGVMLTVFFYCWITGVIGDSIEFNARFSTGHVKVMTRAYAANADQMPNDLALMGTDTLLPDLQRRFPGMVWVERIRFGGLLDVPGKQRETRAQGPVIGFGIDLLSENTEEARRMNIPKSLRRGHLPRKPGDILVSEQFSRKLRLNPGDTVTLISSTMNGEMAMANFVVAGTLVFGAGAMDRGSIIADIGDVRQALDMENAAGEILGYFKDNPYNEQQAGEITARFNRTFGKDPGRFVPVMESLRQQNRMAPFIDMANEVVGIVTLVFLLAMSIVLWNAGLIGGLRRYGEVGLRLAVGEEKGQVYRSMLSESLLIGFTGSVAGTLAGLAFAWILQVKGIDTSAFMKNTSIMMPTVFHARITPLSWYIGFIPGILSTFLGTALSGIGIYRRQTARLFKELES